jgi:PAS domain S-box-containing protein
MTVLGFAFLVIWNATQGLGPFSALSPAANAFALQVFLTLLAIPTFLLAAMIQEQRRIKHALRDREAQYRSIFESTSDGVLITDLDHAVVAANPAFCLLTGYSLDKLRGGHPPRSFLHLDELQPFEAYLARAGAGSGGSTVTRAMCVREDSGLSRFELEGRRFDFGGRPHVLSVVREVTEREKAYQLLERRVAERTRALSTLLEIANTVASTLELEPLLQVVLEQLQMVVRYTGATILVEEEGDLVVLSHRGPLPVDKVSRVRIPAGDRNAGPQPSRDSPFIVDDLWGPGATAAAFRAATPPEVLSLYSYARSLLVVPMKARDQALGCLWIDSDQPDQYNLQDAQLAWALADQAAVAIENTRLYQQARELAAVEERQRLARELHDSVTQTLCGAAMLGQSLPDMWDRDPARGRRAVASLHEMTQGALAEMRALLLELRPDALLQTSLGEALEQLARAQPSRIAAPIHVSVERADAGGAGAAAEGAELPPDVHIALYRIAQEALSNISKHARASSVHLGLRWSRDGATLRVRDDGKGFHPASAGAGHLGLDIMRERAAAIGASLTIDSAPGQGTTITVDWSEAQH